MFQFFAPYLLGFCYVFGAIFSFPIVQFFVMGFYPCEEYRELTLIQKMSYCIFVTVGTVFWLLIWIAILLTVLIYCLVATYDRIMGLLGKGRS